MIVRIAYSTRNPEKGFICGTYDHLHIGNNYIQSTKDYYKLHSVIQYTKLITISMNVEHRTEMVYWIVTNI